MQSVDTPTNERCFLCENKKIRNHCEVCDKPLCSRCVESIDDDVFFYAPNKTEFLSEHHFCPMCFDEKAAPVIAKYDELLARAKQVIYLPKTYRTFVPVLKAAKQTVSVEGCEGKDEAILKLGFLAAMQEFNAIVKAELVCTKTRNHGYQKSIWSGVALPAQISQERLELEEYREEVYRRGY